MIRSIVALFALAMASSAGAANWPLAKDGKALCVITIPTSPSTAETLAAQELAGYLERICGVKFEVRAATTGRRIHVQCQNTPGAEAANPPLPKLSPEGFAIAQRGDCLYLVGADSRGVLYAVYDFLERLGCRWLAPGFAFYTGDHEAVPQRGDLAYEYTGDVVQQPILKYRKFYVEEGHSHTTENLRQLVAWMPKARFNTLVIPIDYQGSGRVRWDNWREALTPELQRRGICIEVGGHGYQNYLNAKTDDGWLFHEHPEWFGQDEQGRRTEQPGRVICSSNPDAVARLLQSALKYLEARPEIEIFDFWPPDGAKWCTCEKCRALGEPPVRHALLVSQMAKAVQEKCPRVRVECLAYSSYLTPPEGVQFDKNVLVDFCPIAQSFEVQINDPASPANARYAAALKAWRAQFAGDISIYSYYRKYAWYSLPIQLPHYMQNDLKFYRPLGVTGVSSYCEPGDWYTYELNHYVLGRLAWNPDSDVNTIVHEFTQARYGPLADTAEKALLVLEETARKTCGIPGTSPKPQAVYDEALERIDAAIKTARDAQHGEAGKPMYAANLKRLGLMLEYARRDIEITALRGPETADRRKALIGNLAAFLQEHANAGVFVLRREDALQTLNRKYAEKPAPPSRRANNTKPRIKRAGSE